MFEQLFDSIDDQKPEMIGFWEQLVNIDSGYHDLAGLEKVCFILEEQFTQLGFQTTVHTYEKAGSTLIADHGKPGPHILLLGHMDTVFPQGTTVTNPFRIEGQMAYGPGVLDMKAGLVQMLFALKALKTVGCNLDGIKVLIVGDEEDGHIQSNVPDLIREIAVETKAALCIESGKQNGEIVLGRKGVGRLMLQVEGKAAHAGYEAHLGANAIMELCHQLIKIEAAATTMEGISVNTGIIQGGSAPNVVPDLAKAEVDVRFEDNHAFDRLEQIVQEIVQQRAINGTTLKLEAVKEYPAMAVTEGNLHLFETIRQISLQNGFGDMQYISVAGGADSSYFAALGVPTICAFGPKGGKIHTLEEYADVESLIERTKLLAAALIELRSDLQNS
ncbi:M20 family metallopeptidase [Brevibacillus nitrificans]|nr:M20 family metallopeptidase [Brevibacillus nitrificans]